MQRRGRTKQRRPKHTPALIIGPATEPHSCSDDLRCRIWWPVQCLWRWQGLDIRSAFVTDRFQQALVRPSHLARIALQSVVTTIPGRQVEQVDRISSRQGATPIARTARAKITTTEKRTFRWTHLHWSWLSIVSRDRAVPSDSSAQFSKNFIVDHLPLYNLGHPRNFVAGTAALLR